MHHAKPIVRQKRDTDLREISLEFHKRAFGEEAARVNFLPPAERKIYLTRIKERVRRYRRLTRP